MYGLRTLYVCVIRWLARVFNMASTSSDEFCEKVIEQLDHLAKQNDLNMAQIKVIARNQNKIIALLSKQGMNLYTCSTPDTVDRQLVLNDVNLQGVTRIFGGLFDGNRQGEFVNGQKRQCVLFRALAINPYASIDDVKTELEHAKEGIQDSVFQTWWAIHKTAIGDRFRDRRSAFVKYIRDNVGERLGMGKCPLEKGNPKNVRN